MEERDLSRKRWRKELSRRLIHRAIRRHGPRWSRPDDTLAVTYKDGTAGQQSLAQFPIPAPPVKRTLLSRVGSFFSRGRGVR